MAERRFCTVRFNLEKPEHQKAWSCLQNMDRTQFKSYSAVIITAVNEYFDKTDTDFADTIVQRILQALKREGSDCAFKINEKSDTEEENIAWDFLGEAKKDIE